MNIELLAGNIAAHWLQAGALTVSALVAMRLLVLNDARARLAALHMALVAIVLLPLVQPWTPDEPATPATPITTTMDVTAVTTESARLAHAGGGAPSMLSPAFAAMLIVVSGVVVRLIWLLVGVARLARLRRKADERHSA